MVGQYSNVAIRRKAWRKSMGSGKAWGRKHGKHGVSGKHGVRACLLPKSSTAGVSCWGQVFLIISGIYVIHFSRETYGQAPSKLVETLISTTIFTHFCLKMHTDKQVSI
jgi:hypothetical protein